MSIVTSAHGGGNTSTGAQLALAPSLRLGVRRVVRGSTDHGNSVYGSLALVVEYSRSFVVGAGSTNHLGLVLQWEPNGNHGDAQYYLLGGPVVSIDEGEAPGSGAGAQLGVGFSFRTRSYPLLFELVAQTLAQGGGVAVRGGLQVGVVF